MNTQEQQLALLHRGVDAMYPTRESFETLLQSGKRLRVYFGIDPTSPTLHIGHAIGLRKLRAFQDLGHEVILLIGSFTAMIGDPTDKMAVRTSLTQEEVMRNAQTYQEQASKILAFDGENPAKLLFNHEWLREMTFASVVELASHFTVQQMLERDMFEKRLQEGKPIHLHEFFYPLMQGYDSVAMEVDVEIGGSDQIFNMLAGRTLQRQIKGQNKHVLALRLLENAEGKKMSKTESGFIALSDTPNDMFGKLMAMDDSMILPYAELVSALSLEKIEEMRQRLVNGENPRDIKAELAQSVVALYSSKESAEEALHAFNRVFKEKAMPENMPEFQLEGVMTIVDVLVLSGLVASKSEARRAIEGNGVKLDGVTVESIEDTIDLADAGKVIQKGKRHFVKLSH